MNFSGGTRNETLSTLKEEGSEKKARNGSTATVATTAF